MKNNGVKDNELTVDESALRDIVRYYTREAGVRALEREVGKICRKVIKQLLTQSDKAKAEGKTAEAKVVNVTGENLSDYLGVRRYTFGMAEKENQIGQVTGLAWTEVGGDLLTIEVADMPGKGVIQRTGSLGDVMKESVEAARTVVRSRARRLGFADSVFESTTCTCTCRKARRPRTVRPRVSRSPRPWCRPCRASRCAPTSP